MSEKLGMVLKILGPYFSEADFKSLRVVLQPLFSNSSGCVVCRCCG